MNRAMQVRQPRLGARPNATTAVHVRSCTFSTPFFARFTVFKPDGPPEAIFINTVLEEPGSAVLTGTGAGLYRLHPKAGIFEHLTYSIPLGTLQSAAVHTLYLAPDQTLWVGATTGLYRREFTGAWLRFDER